MSSIHQDSSQHKSYSRKFTQRSRLQTFLKGFKIQMKALLVEHGKGHYPQDTRQVIKAELRDNCFAKRLFGDQKQVAWQRVTWWLFALYSCFEPEIHPHVFIGATFHRENDPE